jgi:hypothetical protein
MSIHWNNHFQLKELNLELWLLIKIYIHKNNILQLISQNLEYSNFEDSCILQNNNPENKSLFWYLNCLNIFFEDEKESLNNLKAPWHWWKNIPTLIRWESITKSDRKPIGWYFQRIFSLIWKLNLETGWVNFNVILHCFSYFEWEFGWE